MRIQTDHPTTLAETSALIEISALPPTRRRDLVSAIARVCAMSGHHPAVFRAEPAALRQAIAGIRPAAHGIKKQTFANIRSNFVAALALAGVIDALPRGLAGRSPIWGPLVAGLPDLGLRHGLAAFVNWCVYREVSPLEVDDEVVQAFCVWLESRTLTPKPTDLVCRTPRLWNRARRTVDGWPDIELTPISFKPLARHLTWDQFDERFRRGVDEYIAKRRKPDVFEVEPKMPVRPLAESTLQQQREHLRLAASVLVERGQPIDSVTSLAQLVAIEAVKTVLRHYYDQAKGKPNAFATGLAITLKQVARYFVRVAPDHYDEIKRLAGRLPAVPFDLTDKNKALLRELESKELRSRLVYLPETLLAKVARDYCAPPLRHVDAQVAIAVDIDLVAPLRPQNLVRLDWRRHFTQPDGPRGRLLLYIPAEETKTRKRDLIFEIPPEVARRITWYRRHILSRLGADPDGCLFVTRSGNPKCQRTLSQQITETIEEHVGIHMTPHGFRHFAAVSYLEDHPEDTETVRALLGHSWSKTTMIYAGQSSQRASRAYGGFVEKQRRNLKLRRSRLSKRPRKPNQVA